MTTLSPNVYWESATGKKVRPPGTSSPSSKPVAGSESLTGFFMKCNLNATTGSTVQRCMKARLDGPNVIPGELCLAKTGDRVPYLSMQHMLLQLHYCNRKVATVSRSGPSRLVRRRTSAQRCGAVSASVSFPKLQVNLVKLVGDEKVMNVTRGHLIQLTVLFGDCLPKRRRIARWVARVSVVSRTRDITV